MLNLRLTPGYCLALYCLTAITHTLHEFVHHAAGYAVCGAWGYMTFNRFELACAVEPTIYLSTYAGPAFTFALMWLGLALLGGASRFAKHLGLALIFAQTSWQRMLMPFFGKNDEYFASAQLFGANDVTYWAVVAIVWAICLPPLIGAYRAIANKRRALWFVLFFLFIPFVPYALAYWLLEQALVRGVLDEAVIGVPMLAIVNFAATAAALALSIRFIDPETQERVTPRTPAASKA
jgi:hypothetical protein